MRVQLLACIQFEHYRQQQLTRWHTENLSNSKNRKHCLRFGANKLFHFIRMGIQCQDLFIYRQQSVDIVLRVVVELWPNHLRILENSVPIDSTVTEGNNSTTSAAFYTVQSTTISLQRSINLYIELYTY